MIIKNFFFIWYFAHLIVPLTYQSKVLPLENTNKN